MLRLRSLRVLTIVGCVVIAAAPPIGFVRVLETHAVSSAERTLHDYAGRMIGRIDRTIAEGTEALAMLYRDGVASCDLRARELMRRRVAESNVLRELVVAGADGQAKCSSSLVEIRRTWRSEQSIANATHALFVTEDEQG